MNAGHDLERRLADYYATEVPPRAPDRVLGSALSTIDTTRQRRAIIRVPRRFPTMNTYLKWAVAAVVVLAGRSRAIGAASLVMDLAVALLLTTYTSSPLPRPAPLTGALPAASPPPGMTLSQLPTGVIHRTAAFGYRGGAFSDRRDFAMTATLVKHPRGDLLIDTGLAGPGDQFLVRMVGLEPR